MMPRLGATLVCSLALVATPLWAEQFNTNSSARFAAVPPCAPLALAAQTNGIPLQGIDPPIPDAALNPGDSFAALVTLFEKAATRRTQWLIHLQVVAPNAKEQAIKPPPPLTLYSSTGNKLEFPASRAFATLRTLGPFAEAEPKRKPPKTLDQTARFDLNQDFLSLGFDRAAEIVLRQPGQMPKGAFSFQSQPFNAAQIAKAKAARGTLQFTAEDERALAGTAPALISYFEIVQRTAGLDDILFKLVDLPSLWSMLRHGGVEAGFQFQARFIARADATNREPPASKGAYYFPVVMELNKQPALRITLLATPPQSPLLACAGITGMLAEKPGEKENYLTLRILSAHRGQQ